MKKYLTLLASLASCYQILAQAGAAAVIDVSPDKYEYQSQSLSNQLQQVYNAEKQVVEQSKLVQTAKETYTTTKQMYTNINQIYTMQNQAANDYRKFSRILSLNTSDLDCIFSRMAQMFITGLPKNYNGNLGSMMKYDCNSNAIFLYNLLNPYNSYGHQNNKYSIYSTPNSNPKAYAANFNKTLNESNSANLALREMEKKNNVELSAMYSKMAEDEMNKAKQIFAELGTNQDRKPEVENQMMLQADTYLRQSMEHKRLSLQLLTSLKEDKTDLEKTTERRENGKFMRSQVQSLQPMIYGN